MQKLTQIKENSKINLRSHHHLPGNQHQKILSLLIQLKRLRISKTLRQVLELMLIWTEKTGELQILELTLHKLLCSNLVNNSNPILSIKVWITKLGSISTTKFPHLSSPSPSSQIPASMGSSSKPSYRPRWHTLSSHYHPPSSRETLWKSRFRCLTIGTHLNILR